MPAPFALDDVDPDDPGQTGFKGAMVPSVLTPSTSKHFVSPKATDGSTVRLRAQLPHGLEDLFDVFFEWVKPTDPDTGQEVGTADGRFFDVPRAKEGKYTVGIRTKASTGAVASIDTINVWIVSAEITSVISDSVVRHVDDPDPSESSRIGDYGVAVGALQQKGYVTVKFQILPSSMFATKADIPKLEIDHDVPVPGAGITSPTINEDLVNGAKLKWDSSRRVNFTLRNYDAIPLQYFGTFYGQLFKNSNPPNGPYFTCPPIEAYGNDDTNTENERDDPYIAENGEDYLAHNPGFVTAHDKPTNSLADVLPSIPGSSIQNNSYVEMELDFQSFVRLQIGQRWYELPDPYSWVMLLKATLHNSAWIDSGSYLYCPEP